MMQKSEDVRNAMRFLFATALSGSLAVAIALGIYAHYEKLSRYIPAMLSAFGYFMLIHISIAIFERKTGRLEDDVWKSWTVRLACIAATGIVIVAYIFAFFGFYEIYLFSFYSGLSKAPSIILVGFATLAIGGMFFFVRLKWRFVYGVSEACAGVAVASQRFYTDALAAHSVSTAPVVLAILTAGVYLVVRGADNMHQGLTKEPLDPIGQKLLKYLERMGRGKAVQEYLNSPWNAFNSKPNSELVGSLVKRKLDEEKAKKLENQEP